MSEKKDYIAGRIGRASFLWCFLIFLALNMLYVTLVKAGAIAAPNLFSVWKEPGNLLSNLNFSTYLYGLVLIFHLLTVAARLHDRDLSGWLCLFTFVPFLGFVLYLYLLTMPGANNGNRFGPPNTFFAS